MRLLVVIPLVVTAAFSLEAVSQDGNLPRFETYCSRTNLGNSVAEVQWPLAPHGATANLSGLVEQQVLDITVYKDGFQRGLYKTVRPGAAQPEFHIAQPQHEQKIPGLQNLKVTRFGTSQEHPKEGLHMLMRPMPGQESAAVRLEGLEAGMQYFVRLSSPDAGQKSVSFTAAICPVDYVRPRGQ